VRELACQEQQIILLDWSLDGVGLALKLGRSPRLGITDVPAGRASFEDVIERLCESDAHVIAAGSSAAGIAPATHEDRVNMARRARGGLRSCGHCRSRRRAARAIGRDRAIDVGVAAADGEGATPAGVFLGFNVADLDGIRYEPRAQGADRSGLAGWPSLVVIDCVGGMRIGGR
jgi:hypothetical protein